MLFEQQWVLCGQVTQLAQLAEGSSRFLEQLQAHWGRDLHPAMLKLGENSFLPPICEDCAVNQGRTPEQQEKVCLFRSETGVCVTGLFMSHAGAKGWSLSNAILVLIGVYVSVGSLAFDKQASSEPKLFC